MTKIVVSLRSVFFYERSMLGVWESGNQENKLIPEFAFLFIEIDRMPQL